MNFFAASTKNLFALCSSKDSVDSIESLIIPEEMVEIQCFSLSSYTEKPVQINRPPCYKSLFVEANFFSRLIKRAILFSRCIKKKKKKNLT